jgi:hypothetical protein
LTKPVHSMFSGLVGLGLRLGMRSKGRGGRKSGEDTDLLSLPACPDLEKVLMDREAIAAIGCDEML